MGFNAFQLSGCQRNPLRRKIFCTKIESKFIFWVCFPSTDCSLCKDVIESTYWQTPCLKWGHSDLRISRKKYLPSSIAVSTNNVPGQKKTIKKKHFESVELNIINFSLNHFVSSLFVSFNFLSLRKEV